MDNSEQWKHGGNCKECRRKTYCGTPCRASGERNERILSRYIAEAFVNALVKKV